MTHPVAVQDLEEHEAVEAFAGAELDVHFLAAIQHSYEEAKASIDLPPSSGTAAQPHPGTEKIDLRLVGLPAVPAAPTPPTAAMSLAARVVAEQPVTEGVVSAAAPQPVAGHDSPDPATAPRRRGRVAAAISRLFAGSAAIAPTAG